jgi:peptide chain release factor 1
MNVRHELQSKLDRFEELERLMSQPEVLADSSKMAATAREHGSLARLAHKFRNYKKLTEDLQGLVAMSESEDPEERALAAEELDGLRAQREALWDELLEMTIGGRGCSPQPLCAGNSRWHRG